eukprot:GSChrysophyteH2.ASY1.ANO1.313.1 assembled CDS
MGVSFTLSRVQVLDACMHAAEGTYAAKYQQDGFWTDHWTYLLDLVESYLMVFPDREERLLWADDTKVPFFFSPAYVKPRAERYELVLSSTDPPYSSARAEEHADIIQHSPDYFADSTGAASTWQRDKKSGGAFKVHVLAKLLMIATLKFSALDPQGMGVEMEGGKPGWNDAMIIERTGQTEAARKNTRKAAPVAAIS